MNDFEQRVARALHEQAAADVPTVDLWPAIRAQLTATRPRRRARLTRPTTRTGRLAFVLALVVALSGAAWAIPGLRDTLFETLDGLRQVKHAGLTQPIEQSQTIEGVTVTLHNAYADAERIAVGVTIKAADGTSYTLGEADVDGRNGTSFTKGSVGMSYSYAEDLVRTPAQSEDTGDVGVLVTFHPSAIVGSNGMLDLRLILHPQQAVFVLDEQGAPRRDRLAPTVGPFVFDFSIPFNTWKTIEINQTQQAAGVTMTLKRIHVLPSTMNAVLCFDPPTPGGQWGPTATLLVDGLEDNGGRQEVLTDADAGCRQVLFDLSGAQASGWVLRVDTLARTAEAADAKIWPEQERIVGPWEFHYPQRQPAPVPVRGNRIDERPIVGISNDFELTIAPRDGGLLYQLTCRTAKSYLGYRLELFDQVVAAHDQGPDGPVQHCAAGQVLAAGGPIMPPGPLPLQFEVQFASHESVKDDKDRLLYGDGSISQSFIWDADGQIFYKAH